MTERLQKLIARSGLCSRRAAEELLAAGRVRVNGEVAALGGRADPACDRIEVDGKPLAAPAGAESPTLPRGLPLLCETRRLFALVFS